MKMLLSLVGLSVVASLFGCATHNAKDLEVAKGEGRGVTRSFAGSCNQHWPQVINTANHLGLDTLEQHAPNELLAGYQKRGEVGGNFVGVFLEERGGTCEIRVISMRRDDGVPTPNDWDVRFFEDFHG